MLNWFWEKTIEKTIELIQQGYDKLTQFSKTLIKLIDVIGDWINNIT